MEGFFAGGPDSWPCWSFSNHDVTRHATRWAEHGASPAAVAKQAIALLISLEGSIGIYQGEECGQVETVLERDEITDPAGKAFWPDYKGRDGCRTPMVWEADAAHGGFTTGTPWLPVKAPQLARAVDAQVGRPGSVLETYRELLAYRRGSPVLRTGKTRFVDLPEPLLAFRREIGDAGVLCVFNLSPAPRAVRVTGGAPVIVRADGGDVDGDTLYIGPNGFVHLEDGAAELVLKPV